MITEYLFTGQSFWLLNPAEKWKVLSSLKILPSPILKTDDGRTLFCVAHQIDGRERLFECSDAEDIRKLNESCAVDVYERLTWYAGYPNQVRLEQDEPVGM